MARRDDERLQYGGSAYDQQYFTDDQLKQAADIRAAAQNGQTDWGSAHNFVEGIRNQYGYSGGNDGSKYLANPQFNYSPAPTYKSKYQDKIDSIVNQINGLNYDTWKQGDQYRALQDSYTRSGNKAMENTLAQISARTGGLASSYAGTAAQQSYNDFMAQLEDAAMGMYERDRAGLYDQANLYRGLEGDLYGRYADQLNQWNTDRSFTYNMGRDAIGDQRYNQEYADSRADIEYQRKKAQEDGDWEKAQYLAGVLASKGNYARYKELGLTDEEIASMKAYDDQQLALAMAGRSSGGGGGSAKAAKPVLTLAQVNEAIKNGNTSPNVLSAYEYYYGEAYDQMNDIASMDTDDFVNAHTDRYVTVNDGKKNMPMTWDTAIQFVQEGKIAIQNEKDGKKKLIYK